MTETSKDSNKDNENPLLERLSPQQFQASVKFYEADQKLQPQDREQIANGLFSALTSSTLCGIGASIAGSLGPTLYKRYQEGSKVPAEPPKLLRPRFHRPFLSFMLGLTSLLVANQQAAKYQFSRKIANLEGGDEVAARQADVWKAMDYHQAGLFYVYFRKSAEDPSFIIQDPRTYTNKQLHEVHYHPPKRGNGPVDHKPNHWDKIRESNGFVERSQNTESVGTAASEGVLDLASAGENSDNGDSKSEPKSAWDRLRNAGK